MVSIKKAPVVSKKPFFQSFSTDFNFLQVESIAVIMSNQTFPITGIPLVPGQPLPTRQEVTTWYQNDANSHQVSLFMQALTVFMNVPIEERLSYFQIAGSSRETHLKCTA